MSLAPELKKIAVDVGKLLLDPNNPRLFSSEERRVPLESVAEPGVQADTLRRLFPPKNKERFKIEELIQSIRKNRYVPEAGGYIFVRRLEGTEYFLVLEGNRRLVALRELAASFEEGDEEDPEVAKSVKNIDVLEIVDDIPEEQLQEKISYLLGTCHHGSHKNWSPFARAKGIFERYLEVSGQTEDTFCYNGGYAETVASLLSIKKKEVDERLEVYRVMSQLASDPRMAEKKSGGIIDRYYSLILGGLKTSSKELRKYIPRNPDSLELEPEGVDRMIGLCNFDGTSDRKSPREPDGPSFPPAMKNPAQWRSLAKILEDESPDEREQNLKLVEEEHQPPEEVWARRHAVITKLTWPKWLERVLSLLEEVKITADLEDKEAVACVTDLDSLLTKLSTIQKES